MHGWWIFVGCLAAAGLALASGHYRRRRARRLRIDLCRATVDGLSLSALALPHFSRTSAHELNLEPRTSPRSSTPPTEDNLSRTASPRAAAKTGCDVRPRRRVVLSANDLSTTLGPGWRMQ